MIDDDHYDDIKSLAKPDINRRNSANDDDDSRKSPKYPYLSMKQKSLPDE